MIGATALSLEALLLVEASTQPISILAKRTDVADFLSFFVEEVLDSFAFASKSFPFAISSGSQRKEIGIFPSLRSFSFFS